LVELLNGGCLQRQAHPAGPTPGAVETSVRFIEPKGTSSLVLELETSDRTGLLLAVTQALFAEGVQIKGSHISTRELRVHDRFELAESDGSPIVGTRLQRIQLAVLVAVDTPGD
jgi:UTP:GlnB (protein PII) uridylyltransferase